MASLTRGLVFITTTVVASVGLVATPASANVCGVDTSCLTPRAGVDAVKIRERASASSTALGQLNAGQRISCYHGAPCYDTSIVTGQRVTACGTTDNGWWVVRYGGRKAYVSYACVGSGG
jgi:hypothetical protein